jgi:hypothetical protein
LPSLGGLSKPDLVNKSTWTGTSSSSLVTGSTGLGIKGVASNYWSTPNQLPATRTLLFVGEFPAVYSGVFVFLNPGTSGTASWYGTNGDNSLSIGGSVQATNIVPIGRPVVFGFTTSGSSHQIFVDGRVVTSGSASLSDGTGGTVVTAFNTAGQFASTIVNLYGYFAWDRVLSDAELREFSRPDKVWQLFRKRPQILYFDVGGGGATTGTGALTTEPTTLSGTGKLTHKGTGSLTTQPVTLSGAGKLTHTGTGALATYPTLLSATGKLAHIATGSLTIAPITLSGSGALTHKATGSLTTGAVTLSGTGEVIPIVSGTGALTITPVTASGSGKLSHTGTGSLTTIAASLSAAGYLTHKGTGSLTAPVVTLSGEGSVTQEGVQTGTGSLTITPITLSGAGKLSHKGTGSLATTVTTLSGAGSVAHKATGSLTTGVTSLSGAGKLTHKGTGSLTTQPATLSGEGNVFSGTITGTGALTTPAATVSGYDAIPVSVKPAGGGGTSTVSGRKRQKLIIVETVEDVEELLEQVEEIVQAEPKARKLKLSPKKPKQTVQNQPEAAFDWLSYYQAKLDTLRDQQRAESLKRQLDKNAEIIRVILEKQEEEARLALELQQEEEMLLLLMAA